MNKEKARANGLIPEAVPGRGSEEFKASTLALQVARLTRRCGLSASMAEALAPMIFGLLS